MVEQAMSVRKSARFQQRVRDRRWIRQLPAYLVLSAWSLFTIVTIGWIVLASLKSNREVFREPLKMPTELQFENYQRAWDSAKLGQNFMNSVIIVGLAVIIILLVSAPAAYILSRVKFRGSNLITMIYIAGIGVPYPLLFIPLFAMLAGMGMTNSKEGLILVYVSLSIPFTVYILTGFFATLPGDLEDAAVIDGCSDFQVFRFVMLPLASPGILTAAIFNFIGLWNELPARADLHSGPGAAAALAGIVFPQEFDDLHRRLGRAVRGRGAGDGATILLFLVLSERMISGITMGSVK